jgi:hypothetical protein
VRQRGAAQRLEGDRPDEREGRVGREVGQRVPPRRAPPTTAGAGPSRIIAKTSERNAAEIEKVFVRRRNASLTTARARSMKNSAGGSQAADVESSPAATTETTSSTS